MKPIWTITKIAQWTGGKILSTHQENFSEIGTDTRKKLTDQIFIALKGDAFDAHNYLNTAVDQGAGLLIVHELKPEFEELKSKVSILVVNDTLVALQDFAQNYRKTFNAKILAITGSNGKTTTKEYTATILNQFQKTHFNQGSFNNHWGVPLTLLQIPTDAAFAIIEMGMNHAGEITRLVEIADPDVVVCTMVGRAHIEFFGSLQKIADAKAEIYQASGENTVRIFNQDLDMTFDMMYPVAKKFPASRMLSFSENNDEADVYFKIDQMSSRGMLISGSIAAYKSSVTIPVFGKHNITNLMAASCLAYAAGMKPENIWKALPLCKSAWGRNEFIETEAGCSVLFDGYNANPDSMRALLENIPQLTLVGKKIAVFGQMKELGEHSVAEHEVLAEAVAESGFDFIYFIGENFVDFERGLKNKNYKNYFCDLDLTENMSEHFKKQISAGDFVIVKGSRGTRTERFVELCSPIHWKNK
jgi:UDP-N-acetylmuramoyl-tripeptide--D-alanyl-D-alanine ligase